jgi:hypothetical protein
MPAPPEPPAHEGERAARHDGNEDEAGDVVPVVPPEAADGLRRKVPPEVKKRGARFDAPGSERTPTFARRVAPLVFSAC